MGDQRRPSPSITASNALTAKWAKEASGLPGPFVISGAAIWPLLAALAAGAEGRACEELESAVGLPADRVLAALADVLAAVDRRGSHGAIGVWVREHIPVRRGWSTALPAGTRRVLSGRPAADQETLDAWVREHTLGMVDRLPVQLGPETLLLLAACLAIRTTWTRAFDRDWFPAGRWKHRSIRGLQASFTDLARVTVFDTPIGPVTTFNSVGVDAVDVHLVLGAENAAAGDVLSEGIAALAGPSPRRSGGELRVGDVGPGFVVEDLPCDDPEPPYLSVRTVEFEVRAEHDLLRHGHVFGLTAACDASRRHFPGISNWPLAVGQAVQSARATFTATGFEAAAVTAMGLLGLPLPEPPRHTVRVIRLTFGRPFGFVAIDRPSGLVLVAGWVDEPLPDPDPVSYEVSSEGELAT